MGEVDGTQAGQGGWTRVACGHGGRDMWDAGGWDAGKTWVGCGQDLGGTWVR